MITRILPLLAALALPMPTAAQDLSDIVQIDMLPGWRTAQGDHIAAIQITLAPGWITYWRKPGDAGIPPQFGFDPHPDVAMITPHLPVPDVFRDKGLQSYGYDGRVLFPLQIALRDGAGPVAVAGALQIGVCADICIPMTADIDLQLPGRGTHDPAIAAALGDRPDTAAKAGVTSVTCDALWQKDRLQVTTRVEMGALGPKDYVVMETGDPQIWVSQTTVIRDGSGLWAVADMYHPTGQAFALDRSELRITVLSGDGQAVAINGCTAPQ